MKTIFIFAILSCLFTTTLAQNIPWFIGSNSFKEWIISKNVKSITALYPHYSSFQEIQNQKSQRQHIRLELNKREFSFDDLGELNKIELSSNEIYFEIVNELTETNYELLIEELKRIPHSLSKLDSNQLRTYGGKTGLSNFKINPMRYCIDSSGLLFADLWHPIKSSEKGINYSYSHRIIRTTNFESGLFKSKIDYGYYGDFWTPMYSITRFVPLNDSISILKTDAVIEEYEDYYDIPEGPKDTSYCHHYYRHNSNRSNKVTEGFYTNLNIDTSWYPLRTYEEQINGKHTIHKTKLLNIGTLDYKLLPSAKYDFLQQNNCFIYDELTPYPSPFSLIFCDEQKKNGVKTIRVYNSKGKLKKETFYFYRGDHWVKNSQEKRVKNETIQAFYYLNKQSHFNSFSFDYKGHLKVEETVGDKSRVRLSMDNNTIIAEENFNFDKTEYKIKYHL